MDFPIVINWKSLSSFKGHQEFYKILIIVHENPTIKQNSLRWDIALCGITSMAILIAY